VDISKSWFLHPVTRKRIWVFADYPHLLKLLRNHVLDSGITFADGSILNKTTILQLLAAAKNREFSIVPNLTHKHVFLRGQQRQNVASAFQLFSNKTSRALSLLVPGCVTASVFIKAINDLSDVMNTRDSLLHANPATSAYGMHLTEQNKILDFALSFIMKMRVGNRTKTFAPFQRGLIMSIRSLKGLLEDVTSDYRAKYIMTSHVNQDYLENYFSQIRSMGKLHSNPTAVEFQHRIKKLISGKSLLTPYTACVKQQEDTGMISTRLFKQLVSNKPSIEKLSTNHISNKLPADLVIDSLTNLDWNVNETDLGLYDCPQNDRSDEGGLEYVAGFISSKFKEKYPELMDSADRIGFWVRYLSDGGLCEPSKLWFSIFKKFDEIFRTLHHPKNIDNAPGVVKTFARLLSSNYVDLPVDLREKYNIYCNCFTIEVAKKTQ